MTRLPEDQQQLQVCLTGSEQCSLLHMHRLPFRPGGTRSASHLQGDLYVRLLCATQVESVRVLWSGAEGREREDDAESNGPEDEEDLEISD